VAVDRDKTLQTAQKLVDKKKYDKAIAEYRKLIADDPGDVRTLLKIGDLHLRLDSHEDAISTYEQVGEYYYREGFSVKAIAVYKQIRGIIKRHAPHLEGRYGHIVPRLAEIYTQLGLTSDALAAYDEVATRLRSEGRERDALDIFKKVVELDPQNPIAHLRVADSRGRLGDMDKAVERFGQAANIMVKLGRIGDALKVLERLLEYRKDPKWAHLTGKLYLERGEANDGMTALTKLQIAFKANPQDLTTLATLAEAFDVIGQPNKAIEVLKESARIAKAGHAPEVFSQLVDVLMQRAPDDPLVIRLEQHRSNLAAGIDPDVVSDADIMVESMDSLDDVLELEEGDIVEHPSAAAAPPSANDNSGAHQLLIDADKHYTAGNVTQAIQLLRDGLSDLGNAPQLREKLSDLLLEAGDQAGSIAQKLIMARELASARRVEPALEMLDEVLLLQPDQPDALQMRAELGFPMAPMGGREQGIDDLQLNQPLQSYDVESGGVEEALHRSRHHAASATAMPLDDPFAGDQRQPPPPRPSRSSIDEDALDRADAFADLGRFDEARAILHQQLQTRPNHPLILERLSDLDALAAQHAAAPSGPRPISSPGRASQPPSLPPQEHPAPYSPHPQSHQPHPSHPQPQRGYDPQIYTQEEYRMRQTGPLWASEVDSLLDQVREGISNQIADSDAATHYDLGVAYQEMGLHADAISELLLAARDQSRECVCLSMIGNIRLQLGEYDAALEALHRAHAVQYKTREQELALGYEIANTYELRMLPEQALRYWEWLASTEPNYSDPRGSVVDRIHRLRNESGAQPRPQAPNIQTNVEEVQNSYDDMVEKGG